MVHMFNDPKYVLVSNNIIFPLKIMDELCDFDSLLKFYALFTEIEMFHLVRIDIFHLV